MYQTKCTRRGFLRRMSGVSAGVTCVGGLAPWVNQSVAQGAGASNDAGKPQLSACIEALFTQAPFEQRLEQVKAVGLKAFEFWGRRGRNLEALARKKDELGLQVAAFSCDTDGALVASGSPERFVPALKGSIAAAKQLGASRLIVTVGSELKNLSRVEQHQNIVTALKAGASLCEESGITLCLEPLNVLVNHKGYYLATSQEAFQIIDEVGSPNIRLLFDIYHQQITEGNLIQNITSNLRKIGHFHVADVPGRHQPGTGEINYRNVFRSLVEKGYHGFVGLEMWPTVDHAAAVRQVMDLFNEAVSAGGIQGG